ncbi:MAG TPA: hypothetical protein VFZ07_01845 [Dongiaceae bacterium]
MLADAAVSGASGLLLTVLPGPLSAQIGFAEPGYPFAVGIGLIGYAAWLLFSARRPEVNLWAGRTVILVNVLWVAGSAVLLLAAPGLFNSLGQWLVGLVALVVADFALVQYIGLRRAGRSLLAAVA